MPEKWKVVVFFKGIFGLAFIAWLMMWLAGRTDYWQGWVFSAVMILIVPLQFFLFRDKDEMAMERLNPGPGVKSWDIVLLGLYGTLIMVALVVGALDTGRYGWSPELPIWFYVFSYVLFVLSIAAFTWAMYVNKWFSSMVRIQKDRKQKVVSAGPYAIVRHPGYVGG